jgi:hypothetical protein
VFAIRPKWRRYLLSQLSAARRAGEHHAKMDARLVDKTYGPDLGRLLDDVEGTGWKFIGTLGDELVFVDIKPERVQEAETAHSR